MGMTARSARRSELVLASLGAIAVIAFVVIATLVAVPASLVNVNSTVSDGAAPEPLVGSGGEAGVVVPDGWIVRRQSEDVVLVVTPDGGLSARVTVTTADAATVVGEQADGATRTELLGSGLRVFHADTTASPSDAVDLEATDAGEGVVAAVALPDGATVLIAAEVDASATLSEYRPALAQLLEGVTA
jgi:hypothetical protein